MRLEEGYKLCNINGSYFLLPVGQNIALLKKGMRLNDTGVLLWNAIKSGMEEGELLPYLVEYYEADTEDISALQSDINSFIQQLTCNHLIYNAVEPSDSILYFNISNLIISYHGPKHLLHPSLLDFECSKSSAGQHWLIVPQAPDSYPLGEILIRTNEIEIIRNSDDYIITLSSFSQVIQIKISLDGVNARFYCMPSYDTDYIEPLFHAFRHAFLLFAQKQGVFALHSSSVLYQDKVWLFSAPSGTGKSTQADYWKNLFHVRILNGDLNLIQIHESGPMVSGLPWCGTSHIYNNEDFALGGIVLLKRGCDNLALELTKTQQELSLTQRLISPAWTEEMLTYNLEFSHKLVDEIPVFQFLCKNEPAAADTLRQYIDQL